MVGRAELTSALCFMAALLTYTHCCAQGFARCIHLNVTYSRVQNLAIVFFYGCYFFAKAIITKLSLKLLPVYALRHRFITVM